MQISTSNQHGNLRLNITVTLIIPDSDTGARDTCTLAWNSGFVFTHILWAVGEIERWISGYMHLAPSQKLPIKKVTKLQTSIQNYKHSDQKQYRDKVIHANLFVEHGLLCRHRRHFLAYRYEVVALAFDYNSYSLRCFQRISWLQHLIILWLNLRD